jgi:ATP-dependent Clp protease ATP-binding subunit ClpA
MAKTGESYSTARRHILRVSRSDGPAAGVEGDDVMREQVTTEPVGWERYTDRARRVVSEHAAAAMNELGAALIGTEHLLLGQWGEPESVGATVLSLLGVEREQVVAAALTAHHTLKSDADGDFTLAARAALESAPMRALEFGHNYIGTEHLLLALMTSGPCTAAEILASAGVTVDAVRTKVLQLLMGFIAEPREPRNGIPRQ